MSDRNVIIKRSRRKFNLYNIKYKEQNTKYQGHFLSEKTKEKNELGINLLVATWKARIIFRSAANFSFFFFVFVFLKHLN